MFYHCLLGIPKDNEIVNNTFFGKLNIYFTTSSLDQFGLWEQLKRNKFFLKTKAKKYQEEKIKK